MQQKDDFIGRTAVVTGGAQGIGGAVSERLAKGGARVAIWDMDGALADENAAQIGNDALGIVVDVANWASVQLGYDSTLTAFGHVDILVNSAGIAGSNAPVADYPVAEFQSIININLMGTFHANMVVIPRMRARNYGRIVNIASIAGKEGNPNAGAHSASNAGVISLTKSLGKEQADRNIAVNCVAPVGHCPRP
jgi:2-dehydro-3-deoxy-L-rhamnonate dehydrogenase (NAD+)